MKTHNLVMRDGSPLENLRLGKSQSAALDSKTGEINANSQADLVGRIGELMQAVASGQIVEADKGHESVSASEQRKEILIEALADETGAKWASLGASLAQKIYEQTEREGFCRRVTMGHTLKQGDVARVPMPDHATTAVVASSSASVGHQIIRQRVFTPPEFEIIADVRVENLDLEQVSGDLLEHAYQDGLNAIMVQEDRLWKRAADETVGTINPLEYVAGELSTKNLSAIRQSVAQWNLPATTCLIANDYWTDITGSSDFSSFLDPISKYDLVLNGQLGTLLGMELITDAFRNPNQKVLEPGEIYVVASPENHGAHTTRGGVRSTPTSGANSSNSTRGWFMTCPFSLVLANARSVAKGKRL